MPVELVEPLPSLIELDKARREGIYKAAELAVEQVVGLTISSARSFESALKDDIASSSFRERQQSGTGGYVRYTFSEEILTVGGHQALKLKMNFSVCVPKSEDEIAAEQQEKSRKSAPPKLADPDTQPFFDAATGRPRLWYWKSPDGAYEFYDNSGFHPGTGDKLSPVDREVAEAWRKLRQSKAEVAASGQACDRLAANPEDIQRPSGIAGVPYEALKLDPAGAIEACELALRSEPDNPRFLYQLGRARQSAEPQKAVVLYKRAIQKGHLAAYDNLGWTQLRQKKADDARETFAAGAQAGDPSSMVSLAGLIAQKSGRSTQDPRVLALYRRAAELGHRGAKARLAELEVEAEDAEAESQSRARQREQELQIIQGIFGAILRNR